MNSHVNHAGLQVATVPAAGVESRALPGTGIDTDEPLLHAFRQKVRAVG